MANVLIIDDDERVCDILSRLATGLGHLAQTALSLSDGEEKAALGDFDVLFLDVNLPDGNGLEALPGIRKTPSSPEVIIITAGGDADGAELAIKSGAWDYIQKPFSKEEVNLHLARALQYREEKRASGLKIALKREAIIGNSQQIMQCLDIVAQAANSNASVLITGETGTGKELFAQAIHNNSLRCKTNFVIVDCAALPENLVENSLFGHEKGAFTGADKAKAGLVKHADGGTLFLDEIGELPLSVQKAFLRVLQEHRFRPIGSTQEIKSDFRLVAATNRDLDKMVEQQQFRKDLLFRIQAFSLDLPSLRDHPEDINDLTLYFLNKISVNYGSSPKGLSPDFLQALCAYNWPGNVRELINALEKSFAAARNEPTLYATHLPMNLRIKLARESVGEKVPPENEIPEKAMKPTTFRKFREDALVRLEQQYLKDLLDMTNGDIKEACRMSDLSHSRLYALLKKYRISKSY